MAGRAGAKVPLAAIWILLLAVFSEACTHSHSSTSGSPEDTSVSSTAANSVGAALALSDQKGTVAMVSPPRKSGVRTAAHALQVASELFLVPSAFAGPSQCPTILTQDSAGCKTANVSPNAVISYSGCSFSGSGAAYNGAMQLSLSSGSTLACGTFPSPSAIGSGQSIQRQFVAGNPPGTPMAPGAVIRTSERGGIVTIDHKTQNLSNFDGATIAPNIGAGYGTQVVFDLSGLRSQVVVHQRVYADVLDHTVTGTVSVSESGTTRTVGNSTLKVYDNHNNVVATATFNDVVYNNTCCHPISGNVTTSFAAGQNVAPGATGAALVGKSETLTFYGCGSAVLKMTNGESVEVAELGCF